MSNPIICPVCGELVGTIDGPCLIVVENNLPCGCNIEGWEVQIDSDGVRFSPPVTGFMKKEATSVRKPESEKDVIEAWNRVAEALTEILPALVEAFRPVMEVLGQLANDLKDVRFKPETEPVSAAQILQDVVWWLESREECWKTERFDKPSEWGCGAAYERNLIVDNLKRRIGLLQKGIGSE